MHGCFRGQTREFSLLDDLNRAPSDAVWSVDNTSVVTLSTDPVIAVTAVGIGDATLTATWRGFTATTHITVLGVSGFSPGTSLWSIPLIGSGTVSHIAQASTIEGIRLNYVIESAGAADSNPTLRAVRTDGREQWIQAVGGRVMQLSGDPLGGAVVLIERETGGVVLKGFRADGQSFERPGSGGFAIHPDGVLYHVEAGAAGAAQLVGVDIGLGAGPSVALPLGIATTCTGGTIELPSGCSSVPAAFAAGTPTVLADGTVVVPIATSESIRLVIEGVPDKYAVDPSLAVFSLKPDGSNSVTTMALEGRTSYPNYVDIVPFKVIPNGEGGLIVGWNTIRTGDFGTQYGAHAAGIDENGQAIEGTTGVGDWWGDLVLQEANVLAVAHGFNPSVNGKRLQTLLTLDGQPASIAVISASDVTSAQAISGNGIVISYADGTVEGPDEAYQQMDLAHARYIGDEAWIGQAPLGLTAVSGPGVFAEPTQWPGGLGNADSANAAVKPFFTNFHRIELLGAGQSQVTPELVFTDYVRTFAGVNASTIALATQNGNTPNVSGVGQTVTFQMLPPLSAGQSPFSVKSVRYDPGASALVAETLPGHPLRGWRYWRTYRPDPDTLIIETGALDRPAPSWWPNVELKNWIGFVADGVFVGAQMQLWKEYLLHIKNATGLGEKMPPSFPGLVDGKWGWMDKAYVLDNICGPITAPTPIDICRR